MLKKYIQELEHEKIFRLWKAEEYVNPIEYPELRRIIKIDKKEYDFDCYMNEYKEEKIPFGNYYRYNNYLNSKKVDEEKLYNRINLYYGCYKTNVF